jgi:hypothetical protein
MAILVALSLAGSGVALDFRAARILAGATFVFRAALVLASTTLVFCSARSLAGLTLVLPCRSKTTSRLQL